MRTSVDADDTTEPICDHTSPLGPFATLMPVLLVLSSQPMIMMSKSPVAAVGLETAQGLVGVVALSPLLVVSPASMTGVVPTPVAPIGTVA